MNIIRVVVLPILAALLCASAMTGCRGKHRRPAESLLEPPGGVAPMDDEPVGPTVKVIKLGTEDPVFHSAITAPDGPVRLYVASEEPAGTNQTPPEYLVHFHPDDPPQQIKVLFDSPPMVEFEGAGEGFIGPTGWLYFYGKSPIGKTRRVRAVGSGTEFLIEITADADYVYMLGGARDMVLVYTPPNAPDTDPPCVTLRLGEYTRVDNAGTCTAPATFYDGGDREAFVEAALAEIGATEWVY